MTELPTSFLVYTKMFSSFSFRLQNNDNVSDWFSYTLVSGCLILNLICLLAHFCDDFILIYVYFLMIL